MCGQLVRERALVAEFHHVFGRAKQVSDLLGFRVGSGNRRSSELGSCGNLGWGLLAALRTDGTNDRQGAERLVLAAERLKFKLLEKFLLGDFGLDHGIEGVALGGSRGAGQGRLAR